ncbi:MAG: hypothetical protein R2862_01145 [Thermoanaerobaculia bacterium]
MPTPLAGALRRGARPPEDQGGRPRLRRLALDPRVTPTSATSNAAATSRSTISAALRPDRLFGRRQSDRQLAIPGETAGNGLSSTAFVAWYSCPTPISSSFPWSSTERPRRSSASATWRSTSRGSSCAIPTSWRRPTSRTTPSPRSAPADRPTSTCSPGAARSRRSARLPSSRSWDISPESICWSTRTGSSSTGSEQELASEREAQKNLELLRAFAERGVTGAPRRIHLRFLVSPVEVVESDGRVSGLRVERNRLVPGKWGLSAEGTGTFETLPVGLVVRAVGYRSLPLPDLPFDDRRGIVPNASGRIVDPTSGEGDGRARRRLRQARADRAHRQQQTGRTRDGRS